MIGNPLKHSQMTRKELFREICADLSAVYPAPEAEAIARALFEFYHNLDRTDLYLDPHAEIGENRALESAVRQVVNGRPWQYATGEASFCGLPLAVDERVLIPRPETEELVRWIVDDHRGAAPKILDVGTGSGAIAIALMRGLPGSEAIAIDVSDDALDLARENAGRCGVGIRFERCDILHEKPAGKFDVVVSNPPYVRLSERAAMRGNVLDYEPHAALFVPDDDPLLFYRAIAGWGFRGLTPGGRLYFEINEAFGPETAQLLAGLGYHEVELRQDLFGKDRMVKGRLPLTGSMA